MKEFGKVNTQRGQRAPLLLPTIGFPPDSLDGLPLPALARLGDDLAVSPPYLQARRARSPREELDARVEGEQAGMRLGVEPGLREQLQLNRFNSSSSHDVGDGDDAQNPGFGRFSVNFTMAQKQPTNTTLRTVCSRHRIEWARIDVGW